MYIFLFWALLRVIECQVDVTHPIDDFSAAPTVSAKPHLPSKVSSILKQKEYEKHFHSSDQLSSFYDLQEQLRERRQAFVHERDVSVNSGIKDKLSNGEIERDIQRERERTREVMLLSDRYKEKQEHDSEFENRFSDRIGEPGKQNDFRAIRNPSLSSIELEHQREKDRKEEIEREVSKALKKKDDLLSQPGSFVTNSASIQVNDRIGQGPSDRLRDVRRKKNWERRHSARDIDRQRERDRAQRGGSDIRERHDRNHEDKSERKPPILIYEKVTEYIDRDTDKIRGKPIWPTSNRRPNSDRHSSNQHQQHSSIQDTRAPDRPVAFRPIHTDRRPGRPASISGYEPHDHHHHYVEILPNHEDTNPVRPVGHIVETVQHGVVPSLDIADAAKAQALQHQILAGQAIRANKLKQIALAARLKAIQVRKFKQHQAALQLQAIKALAWLAVPMCQGWF